MERQPAGRHTVSRGAEVLPHARRAVGVPPGPLRAAGVARAGAGEQGQRAEADRHPAVGPDTVGVTAGDAKLGGGVKDLPPHAAPQGEATERQETRQRFHAYKRKPGERRNQLPPGLRGGGGIQTSPCRLDLKAGDGLAVGTDDPGASGPPAAALGNLEQEIVGTFLELDLSIIK